MRKRILSLVLLLAMCVTLLPTVTLTAQAVDATMPASGDGTSGNPYQIGTAGELLWFAGLVNGTLGDGTTQNTSANAVLTQDIDLKDISNWAPIGAYRNSTSNVYNGTFDGAGYTVSNLYISLTGDYQGLFGYNTGTIKNVTVSGNITAWSRVAGVCGYNGGTISGCWNQVNVTTNNSEAFLTGGVCGYNSGTITNCCNTGSVTSSSSQFYYKGYPGGICGYNEGGTISNCFNAGSVTGSSLTPHSVCGVKSRTGTITNCYYLEGLASDSNATSKTKTQFTSGEVCYLLNGSVSGGTTWYQTIGTDDYPVPFSGTTEATHGTVYVGYTNDGTLTYANDLSTLAATQPSTNEDGVYQISNAQELRWFAGLVNGTWTDVTKNTSAKAVLTADIDLKDIENWTPIGNTTSSVYTGTFDGQGHTISNLTITGSNDYAALFGVVGGDVIIQNVVVTGSVTGKDFAAGLVGGSNGSGIVTIKNCGNEATVTGTGRNAAGIFGVDQGSGATIVIENCYNTGSITGGYESGAISGFLANNSTVTNCYNTGTVVGNKVGLYGSPEGKTFVRYASGGATITNCYQLDEVGKQDGVTSATKDEFSSGKVAYLLNGTVDSDGNWTACADPSTAVWRQNLDNSETVDTLPVLNSTHGAVYQVELLNCLEQHYSPIKYTYSNKDAEKNTAHDFTGSFDAYDENDHWHICNVDGCDATDTSEAHKFNENTYTCECGYVGTFEISSEETLQQFAKIVANNPSVNGKVVKSFAVSGSWTPMGTKKNPYTGTFDGGNYIITGLTVRGANSGEAIGLFGYINGATIKNVKLANVKISASGKYSLVGGICGCIQSGTIGNCTVGGTVDAYGQYGRAGGICGCIQLSGGGTVMSCTNSAAISVSGQYGYSGGICGINYSTVTGGTNSGYVRASGQGGCAGGACGKNYGAVSECTTSSTVRVSTKTSDYSADLCG